MGATIRRWAAGAALVLAASAAHADCERSNRVGAWHAECLSGGIDRERAKHRLWARNECPHLGTVYVKWDIADQTDRTWHLNGSETRRGTVSSASVTGPWCCQDLGACNRRDRSAPAGPYTHDEAGCRAQWRRSGAAKRCDLIGVEYKRGKSRWCRLDVRCETGRETGGPRTKAVYRSVRMPDVDALKWCPQVRSHQGLVYNSRC